MRWPRWPQGWCRLVDEVRNTLPERVLIGQVLFSTNWPRWRRRGFSFGCGSQKAGLECSVRLRLAAFRGTSPAIAIRGRCCGGARGRGAMIDSDPGCALALFTGPRSGTSGAFFMSNSWMAPVSSCQVPWHMRHNRITPPHWARHPHPWSGGIVNPRSSCWSYCCAGWAYSE